MEQKTDYRITKTKYRIKEAFLNLLAKHDFDHITVMGICEKADITRATFYKYYPDKFVLADEILSNIALLTDQLYEEIYDTELSSSEKCKLFIKKIIESVVKIRKVILSISEKEGNILLSYIVKSKLNSFLNDALTRYQKKVKTNVPNNFMVAALEGAIEHVIIEWLQNPNGLNENEISEYIYSFLANQFDSELIF